MPLRLRQEVQEVPRRLTPPDPPLADDAIVLRPLEQADGGDLLALAADEDVLAFTRVPRGADAAFVSRWIARYERGWSDGSCAGFSIRDRAGGGFLGFGALVDLDLDGRQGEIGYMLAPVARGRGAAVRTLRLLTAWSFDGLGLERLELRIDVDNPASARVAERAGYEREGILRNLHIKGDVRADTAIWSRLRAR